jgi:hypothetical protein
LEDWFVLLFWFKRKRERRYTKKAGHDLPDAQPAP